MKKCAAMVFLNPEVTRHAGADDWDDRTVLILGGGTPGRINEQHVEAISIFFKG